MANEGPQIRRSYVAGQDLTGNMFTFVKFSAARTIVPVAAATDRPIGVLQNAPRNGEEAEVCVFGETKLVASGALAFGVQLGTDATGKGVAIVAGTDTTKYLLGTIEDPVNNAGSLCTAFVNCSAPARGA